MFAEFVEGPFWYFSLAVFVLGIAWRLAGIFSLQQHESLSAPRQSASGAALTTNLRRFFPRREFYPRVKVQVIAGYMFHVGLFLVLFFAKPHVEFYAKYLTGFEWIAMPRWAFILAAELAFAGLILLWLYRLLNPVTRLISRSGDHLATILVFLVMLTGCLALLERFEGLRLIHFFLAELLLIYFPFSSLFHAFSFPVSRGYTGVAYGRRGVSI
jgi:nitrate reductase gamma subunit